MSGISKKQLKEILGHENSPTAKLRALATGKVEKLDLPKKPSTGAGDVTTCSSLFIAFTRALTVVGKSADWNLYQR
jgi:hypothetical protein